MMKYMNGMITGIVVGATIGIMVVPQLDRKSQKAVKKASEKVFNLAENSCEGMFGKIM